MTFASLPLCSKIPGREPPARHSTVGVILLLFLIPGLWGVSCSPPSGSSPRVIVSDLTSPDTDVDFVLYAESFATPTLFEETDILTEARIETLGTSRWTRIDVAPKEFTVSGFETWYCRPLFPVKDAVPPALLVDGEELRPLEEDAVIGTGITWKYKKLDYFYPEGIYVALPARLSHPTGSGTFTVRYFADERKIRKNELHLSGMTEQEFLRRYETLGRETRFVLYCPGESRLDFPGITIPLRAELRFGIGVLPYLQSAKDESLEFRILFRPKGRPPSEVFSHRPTATPSGDGKEKQSWLDFRVPMDSFGGKKGIISLVTGLVPPDTLPSETREMSGAPWRYRLAWSRPLLSGRPEEERGDPAGPPRGIIVILIDTLRKDHLGCYGYGRPTSPTIDSLGARGALFENAISQSSWTRPAIASLFTSTYPRELGILAEDFRQKLPPGYPTVAEQFRKNGYVTWAIVTNIHLKPAFGLHQGFDSLQFFLHTADKLTDKAVEWLNTHQDLPFFLYLHYVDPHSPYRDHAEFDFLPDYRGAVYHDPQKVFRPARKALLDDAGMKVDIGRETGPEETYRLNEAELEKMIALYDGEIRFVDHHLGRLFREIRSLGLESDIAILVTADHGEEFREHGGYFHGYTLYGEQVNVPLIFSLPGIDARRIESTVQLIDIPVTLCDFSGFTHPGRDFWEGVSFLDLLRDDPGQEPVESGAANEVRRRFAAVAVSETHFRGARKISLERAGRKVIYDYGQDMWKLYDLDRDPLETGDLLPDPDRFAPEIDCLRAWMKAHPSGGKLTTGEASDYEKPDRQTIEQLEALGYIY